MHVRDLFTYNNSAIMSNPHQFHGYAYKGSRRGPTTQYSNQRRIQPALPPTKVNNRNVYSGDHYYSHQKTVTVYVKKNKEGESPAKKVNAKEPYYALPKEISIFARLKEDSFPLPTI